jgi:hypothetical protein
VLLTCASVLVIGCAGSSPLAPTESPSQAGSVFSNDTSSAGVRSFLPPINPAGISCPSDAPQLALGSLATRLDIEFSEVAGAQAYEIEIMDYWGAITRLEIAAPAHRAEWYGAPGLYRVRARTINCGGLGNWSAELFQTLDDGTKPPPPPPAPPTTPGPGPAGPNPPACSLAPTFNVQSTGFVFNPSGALRSGTVVVNFNNAGTWELQLVASTSNSESSTSSGRATGGTVKESADVVLACGQSSTQFVHARTHTWKYWWFRVYRDGALVYTSDRFSM